MAQEAAAVQSNAPPLCLLHGRLACFRSKLAGGLCTNAFLKTRRARFGTRGRDRRRRRPFGSRRLRATPQGYSPWTSLVRAPRNTLPTASPLARSDVRSHRYGSADSAAWGRGEQLKAEHTSRRQLGRS
jgi:hypothetical protein